MKKPRVTNIRQADAENVVVTVEGGDDSYCAKPCKECPWRKENKGTFPAKAFVHSANTAYDLSGNVFGCHMTGTEKPATCAGFLLKGSYHNLAVRMKLLSGAIKVENVSDGGANLFESYRQMAIANGVARSHPALRPCRD
jgi:hypothetical protein